MWLRDLLPSYIPDIRVFAFAYDIEGGLSPESLKMLGLLLLEALVGEREPHSVGAYF